MSDARFEDGDEGPLRLLAHGAEDLAVIAALVQDAIFPITEMTWHRKTRSFALLLNRFRWEDHDAAQRAGRPFERVRSLLTFEGVLAVRSQGIDRDDRDTVLSVLSLTFTQGEDGAGRVELVLAGDGAVELQLEAVDAVLADVSRPYLAPSGKAPAHGV